MASEPTELLPVASWSTDHPRSPGRAALLDHWYTASGGRAVSELLVVVPYRGFLDVVNPGSGEGLGEGQVRDLLAASIDAEHETSRARAAYNLRAFGDAELSALVAFESEPAGRDYSRAFRAALEATLKASFNALGQVLSAGRQRT